MALIYPWMMHKPGGESLIVWNAAEQEAAIREGWSRTFDDANAPQPEPAPEPEPKKRGKK